MFFLKVYPIQMGSLNKNVIIIFLKVYTLTYEGRSKSIEPKIVLVNQRLQV